MLEKKPQNRLGFSNIEDVKKHSWIKYYNWSKLYNKQLIPPFVPLKNQLNFDKNYVKKEDKIPKVVKSVYEKWLKNKSNPDPFKNYYFDINLQEKINILTPQNIIPKEVNKTPSTNNNTPLPFQLNKNVQIPHYINSFKKEEIKWSYSESKKGKNEKETIDFNDLNFKIKVQRKAQNEIIKKEKIYPKETFIVQENKTIKNMDYILSKYYQSKKFSINN